MYYPCSENKGADQLRGYREADLRLCFRLGKNPVFSWRGSIMLMVALKSEPEISVNQPQIMASRSNMAMGGAPMMMDSEAAPLGAPAGRGSEPTGQVRTKFPETWIWTDSVAK